MKRFLTLLATLLMTLTTGGITNVFASEDTVSISVIKGNDLDKNYCSSANISCDVVSVKDISAKTVYASNIGKYDLSDVDSVIINRDIENNKTINKTDIVYDTMKWTETVKASIVIGKNSIQGDRGDNCFSAPCYIQPDTSSSMIPFDGVAFLAKNMSMDDIEVNMGKNNSSVKIKYDGKEIIFNENSDKIIIGSIAKDIANNAYCEKCDDTLYIPLRSLSDVLGCKVDWVADGKIVKLEKSNTRVSKVQRLVTTETSTETTTAELYSGTKISNISIGAVNVEWNYLNYHPKNNLIKNSFGCNIYDIDAYKGSTVINPYGNYNNGIIKSICNTYSAKSLSEIPSSIKDNVFYIISGENLYSGVSLWECSQGAVDIDVNVFKISWGENGVWKSKDLSGGHNVYSTLPDEVKEYIRREFINTNTVITRDCFIY